MSLVQRITIANCATAGWGILVGVSLPFGVYNLSEKDFLALLFGGALAVWGAIFVLTSRRH
jgi:hypothetical protein